MGAPTNISFGLLGHPLGHSWSPQIHARLGTYRYDLVDLSEDSARAFLLGNGWQGLNVTIPYKRMAAELANQRSHRVERLGVANTLVRQQDDTIFAENTDVLGFVWMLDRFCKSRLGGTPREVLGTGEALVLGTGGAAQAVRAAIEDSAGCTVSLISRRGSDTYENLIERHPHARLVVNATPVGMYPNCPESPLSTKVLSGLLELRGVLDVVYNPERTGLCLAAEQLGIASESGLAMLVAQAHFASELFQGRRLDDSKVGQIEDAIRRSQIRAEARAEICGSKSARESKSSLRKACFCAAICFPQYSAVFRPCFLTPWLFRSSLFSAHRLRLWRLTLQCSESLC